MVAMRWDGVRAELERRRQEVGLCLDCTHMRAAPADRDAGLFECLRSFSDPAYRQYPRLPVRDCPGYQPGPEAGDG
jgi:hypothetical protein